MGATSTAAFEAAYPELQVIAARAARRVLRTGDGSEDVAAEAMTRLWLHWHALDLAAARRWVARVATNLAIDVARRRPVVVDGADRTRCPDDEVLARETVLAAVGSLAPRQREAVVLRHLVGMSQLEIAAALGIARATAAVHLARGEAAIRTHLSAPDETTRRERMQVQTIEEAIDAMAAESVLTGTVTAAEEHGLRVDIGIPAFMAARFVDVRPVDDLDTFVGRPVDCIVRGVSQEKGLVFVSRMHAIEGPDDRARRRAWFAGLQPGDRLPGIVSSKVGFGWFVDVAGGTGLVHVSDAGDAELEVGARLEVEVLRVDPDAERISLRPAP